MDNRLQQFWHSSVKWVLIHGWLRATPSWSSDEDFEILIANYWEPRAILAVRSSVLKNALHLTTVYE